MVATTNNGRLRRLDLAAELRLGSNLDSVINPKAREKWLPCFGKSWGDRFKAGWEIGFTWFDRRGGGGWTEYAAPLGLKISLGVWC
jgi:hypothetical protein